MDLKETQEIFYRRRIAELALLATTTSNPALRIELLVMVEQFHRLAAYVANENARLPERDAKKAPAIGV